MSKFETCLPLILKYEGGKVDNKNDRGGRTAYGITQRTYDAYCDAHGRARADVWDIDAGTVADIYQRDYWLACHAFELPAPVDLVTFDAAVNSGPKRAIQWLQAAAGVEADGVIGPHTLAAVQAAVPASLANAILARREAFYHQLAQQPGQAVFLKGWLARLTNLRHDAGL